MNANTSSAVMQQRREAHDSLDDFPTPPWATRALCETLVSTRWFSCRDPAANRGHMARPLAEFFGDVEVSDIFDYGMGYLVQDYLFGPAPDPVDWTISNPPFRLAVEFIERALATSRCGVAMLVRSAFLEGGERHNRLFLKTPPTHILQFVERVIMHKGALRDPSLSYWNWDMQRWQKPSSATAYCWLVWENGQPRQPLCWIEPCRGRLELPGDYPRPDQPYCEWGGQHHG